MQIDRSRFLVLSASIAASACGAAKTDSENVEVATPVEVEPSRGGEPVLAEPTIAELPSADSGTSLQEMCDSIEPPPGPHCESFSDSKSSCATFIQSMEPEAAERAVSCLVDRSKTAAICDYNSIPDCFIVGISDYAEDPRHAKQCANVASMCAGNRYARGDLTAQSCGAAMGAVRDDLESRLISCMAEGCGIGTCVWRLD